MNWERFFHYLARVNAIGIFALLATLTTLFVKEQLERPQWDSCQSDWAREAQHKTLFKGSELKTAKGSVVAYEVVDQEGMGRRQGSNVSLVNLKTGASLTIAPENSSVVNWEILFAPGSNDRIAVGYTASVSTPDQFKKGRLDLVVGTLPDLKQTTVAKNIVAADLPKVQGDGSLALVMWPEAQLAMFVTVDLTSGKILNRNQVPLPRIGNDITSDKPESAGLSISR